MSERQTVELKLTHAVCARCGSRLSFSGDAEMVCVTCLLHIALRDQDGDYSGSHRFDQYELITDDHGTPVELGRGAMAVTYKAFDTNLRCEVALKVIHPRYLVDGSGRARFLSEARAAAQLRHRNIASVFHLGSERGECFYAMELVEGETIEDRVRDKGPIEGGTALEITLQITRALAAAGDRKFVHRDVKPSNVMLCSEADGVIAAKLIDFGLVRDVTDQSASASGSPVRTGFIGTPHFASPEQFAGEMADGRSDIYSLGATLWFMLTGKLPFDGGHEQIRQQQLRGVLPLDQLRGVPRPIVDLIRHMLEVDPAKRPQSPAALKEQLNKCTAAIDAAKQKQPRRYAYGVLAAVAFVVAALGASYIFQRKLTPSAPGEIAPEKTIAVLPFENLSRDPENAFFADGIRAQIVARLAKVMNLKIVSGSSTRRYQSAPEDLVQVAAALGVANVLEGSVQREGEKFRITVRLMDAKNNVDLWRQSYDRVFRDVLQVESEVARRAAGALGLKLTQPEKRAIDKSSTSNPQAYEAYLKGRYIWLQRTWDGYRQAKEYFDQAITLDPNYAQAYAGLAEAYHFLADLDPRNYKENIDKAKTAYQRALRLDPMLPEAHAIAGLVAMNYDWDWPLAEQELGRAIALDPNEALFYDWNAEYLMAVGRASASIDNIERARELDPFSVIINSDLGKLLYFARLYDEAEAQLKQTLRMDPDFIQPHRYLGGVYIMKHRFDDAISEFEIAKKDGDNRMVGLMTYAYGMAGRKIEAAQMLEAIKNLAERRGDLDKICLAWAYIGLGEKDRAIACLEEDYKSHRVHMTSLKSNPEYDPLRSDPRFVDLMSRVHLAP